MDKFREILNKIWEALKKVLPFIVLQYVNYLRAKIARHETQKIILEGENAALQGEKQIREEFNDKPAIEHVRDAIKSGRDSRGPKA